MCDTGNLNLCGIEDVEGSEVAEWYRNQSIFITGGTGFMGKVLIEKLLRTCPVKRIYVLVRPKKGVEVNMRIEHMFTYKLFDTIKASNPDVLHNVVAIKGDITMENLGISEESELILADEVSIVFHAAATINFQEPLRVAVNMNMLGTKRVVALAKKMKKLKALCHISTAYGNCHLKEIREELYPSPIDPSKMIQMTEWLDDDLLDTLTSRLVHPRPNTYTYTKALAEHILVTDGKDLPVVIIRPAIVCGAWREPTPGWVDNMFAFTGLLVGMGKGFLRSLYVKPGIKLDFIPVDVPINLMIVAAWNNDVKKYIHTSPTPIYCAATGSQKPLTIEKLQEYLRNTVWKNPLDSPIWFPDGSAKSSKMLHNLHVYIINVIPSYIGDMVLRVLGKKPIAMKMCNRMIRAINALEYFMLRDWTFSNENVRALWDSISEVDKRNFHFDISDLNWQEYIDNYQMGCKRFIMNEDLVNLPTAKRTLTLLYGLHKLVQVIIGYGVWCAISSESATQIYSGLIQAASDGLSMAPIFASAEETGPVINS